ncbi:uncharacterized protein TNCT_110861, partial [Trichonephila clavata]
MFVSSLLEGCVSKPMLFSSIMLNEADGQSCRKSVVLKSKLYGNGTMKRTLNIDSLVALSDLQEEAEETKVSFFVLLSNYESENETVNSISKNNHVKLPDLPLPTFSGKFQEFEQFILQFMNLIGNNPSLNEVQKLCYLKGALKNEASLIQSDQDTFDSLMKALEVWYENTRALVDIHIAEILSINKLTSKNPSQIRSIVDKVRNHLSYLKFFNFESNPLSDATILHVLSNKVDKESQRLFHLSLTTTKVP